MRVGDLQDLDTLTPWVDLKGSKTEAARRSLLIHSQALATYLRRAEGKGADDYVLDELRTPPEGRAMERGPPITKLYMPDSSLASGSGRRRKALGRERGPAQPEEAMDHPG